MAKKLEFLNWFESRQDIFGFDKDKEKAEKREFDDKIVKITDLPVRQFNLDLMVDYILRESHYDPKPAFSRFITEVQWGSEPGAMRLVITPKYHAIIQRLHTDLEGDPVWLCKKVFGINAVKYAGKEDIVASELHEAVLLAERQGMENPNKEADLNQLAIEVATKFKRESNDFLYFQGMKQVSEREYAIYFSAVGGGVGRSVSSRHSRQVLEYIINVSLDKKKGLYTVFNHFVSEQDEGSSWGVLPAEFIQKYMPSQSKSEIIDSIVTSLRYF